MKRITRYFVLAFIACVASITSFPALPAAVVHADPTQIECADGTVVRTAAECTSGHHGAPVPMGSVTVMCDNGAVAPNGDVAQCSDASPCPDKSVALSVSIGGKHCISDDPTQGGAIIVYLRLFLQFLSTLIGIVIILMLVIAGIQYITSAGDPSQVKNAKNRIVNAITALILFLSGFAILSFIVPGGIV